MSVAKAPFVPHSTPTRAMILASTWASGRNTRLTSSGWSIDPIAVMVCHRRHGGSRG